jgi:hypothetical protein
MDKGFFFHEYALLLMVVAPTVDLPYRMWMMSNRIIRRLILLKSCL